MSVACPNKQSFGNQAIWFDNTMGVFIKNYCTAVMNCVFANETFLGSSKASPDMQTFKDAVFFDFYLDVIITDFYENIVEQVERLMQLYCVIAAVYYDF